MKEEYLPL